MSAKMCVGLCAHGGVRVCLYVCASMCICMSLNVCGCIRRCRCVSVRERRANKRVRRERECGCICVDNGIRDTRRGCCSMCVWVNTNAMCICMCLYVCGCIRRSRCVSVQERRVSMRVKRERECGCICVSSGIIDARSGCFSVCVWVNTNAMRGVNTANKRERGPVRTAAKLPVNTRSLYSLAFTSSTLNIRGEREGGEGKVLGVKKDPPSL